MTFNAPKPEISETSYDEYLYDFLKVLVEYSLSYFWFPFVVVVVVDREFCATDSVEHN